MIDYLIRAETKAAWNEYAFQQGLTGDDGDPAKGVLIDEIGQVMLEPPVFSADGGTVVTPAVMDSWHHVNLRVTGDTPLTFPAGKAVTTTPRGIDAMEFNEAPSRVQFLDPADIVSPIRIWADGMYFLSVGA
jgi:hypothetical protein